MLDPKRLGLAGGIVWGLVVFVFTLLYVFSGGGYAEQFLLVLNSLYLGYSMTVPGAFVGLFWGFVYAGVGLFLLGLIYNLLPEKKL